MNRFTRIAAAALVAATAFGATGAAQARQLAPAEIAVQGKADVVKVGHRRADRDRRHDRRWGHHDRRLRRGQIVRRLSWQGFYGFSRIRDRGRAYAVNAFGPRGHRVHLRVDAYTGRILRARPVGGPRRR